MKKKADWWIRAMFLLFIIIALSSMCSSCGKLLEGTGNILQAGGQGLAFVGDHLVETGTTEK